jgi:hypothetical protein
VSYIVTTVPTTTTAAAPTRPSTDNTGTLVDNRDGSYVYTFYRDITQIKTQVDGMTVTGVNDKADLGDLTYEPTLVHRLTIQLSGSAPGTGTNTPGPRWPAPPPSDGPAEGRLTIPATGGGDRFRTPRRRRKFRRMPSPARRHPGDDPEKPAAGPRRGGPPRASSHTPAGRERPSIRRR